MLDMLSRGHEEQRLCYRSLARRTIGRRLDAEGAPMVAA